MIRGQYLRMFECCRLVKGANRSIVCDLQRGAYHFIPNDLFDFINLDLTFPVDSILEKYKTDSDNSEIVEGYISFLLKEEYAFLCSEQERSLFPPMRTQWEEPCVITNSIIDISHPDTELIGSYLKQLDKTGCRGVQFRFMETTNLETLEMILTLADQTCIEAIEVFLPYHKDLSDVESIKRIKLKHQKVFNIVIFGSPWDIEMEMDFDATSCIFSSEVLSTCMSCGKISSGYFVTNVSIYMESLFHNSCLNRKISIDAEGNIKNCPSMSQSFGNLRDTTLQQALEHPDFKKYWNVTKDQIEVCKDCEFRYICTDCRAYIENPDDMYSKPLKCGYNPYTCEWEEWSTNPLKQKAIDYYGMRDVLPEFQLKPDFVPGASSEKT